MRWLRGRSARTRITLLYAGLFLILGTAMLAFTNVLASHGAAQVVAAAPSRPVAVVKAPASVALAPAVRQQLLAVSSGDHSRLLGASWIALALATVLSALFGWFAAGRVLRPVRTITAMAQTISAGSLDSRLALDGADDEFKALGDTLDDLFARLDSSFRAQRRFVANASHELRTPLTLERTLLQVALADPQASVSTLRATCEELLSANAEQAALLEALLTLASSERGLDRRDPVELNQICTELLDAATPRAHALAVQLSTDLAPAPAIGDPALVRRLIGNLLDNALQYNHPGGTIEIKTWTQQRSGCLLVANSGPAISNAELERLFEPFQRLSNQRIATDIQTHGVGLGLSIVRAIADTHAATIAAVPRPNGGLAMTVIFPPPTCGQE
ncbi:MAG: sensor histidine kinase [Solirubrobacteraceae bacterium]